MAVVIRSHFGEPLVSKVKPPHVGSIVQYLSADGAEMDTGWGQTLGPRVPDLCKVFDFLKKIFKTYFIKNKKTLLTAVQRAARSPNKPNRNSFFMMKIEMKIIKCQVSHPLISKNLLLLYTIVFFEEKFVCISLYVTSIRRSDSQWVTRTVYRWKKRKK